MPQKITPSKILFWFCISFIAGIGLASFSSVPENKIIGIPQTFIWAVLFLGTVLIVISFPIHANSPKISAHSLILGFCFLLFVLGILRLQISEFSFENDQLRKLNDSSEKVTLIGQIVDDPDIRDKFQRLKLRDKETGSLVLITAARYPEYKYLDAIKVKGNLKTPDMINGFNYKNYLLKDGVYSVMGFPKIETLAIQKKYNLFSFLYEKILFVKAKLKDSIDKNFSKPQNFIAQGIILGNDKNMPKDLRDKFNSAGLSHITAVSGSNIVILTSLLVPFLLTLGFWRDQAFYLTVSFVWIYILLVGVPASGVRSAIMASLFLLAEKLGRQSAASRIIVLAAALMLMQNPFLLFYDIGFQLSFLASMGIIHLNPLVAGLFKINFNKLFFLIKRVKIKNGLEKILRYFINIVSITLSAQVFTLPIIVYNFGTISLIAPLTNLLALPAVEALMPLGIFSASLGAFSGFLGWVFALPCYFLIFYFLKILDVFYQPWAVVSFSNLFWLWVVLYYIALCGLIVYLKRKSKPKFLGY